MGTTFRSSKGEIPEIDPARLDLIVSLLTTFESNDLHTRNAINFKYDRSSDYVFLEILAIHNGMNLIDYVLGYDREKVVNVCKSILEYFSLKKSEQNG
jgi:hypothetical protein